RDVGERSFPTSEDQQSKDNKPNSDDGLDDVVGQSSSNFFKTLASDAGKYLANKGLNYLNTRSAVFDKFLQSKINDLALDYGVPKGANRAALKVASNVLTAVPILGNILSAYEAFTGKDWLTGGTLTAGERALSLLGTILGANTLK